MQACSCRRRTASSRSVRSLAAQGFCAPVSHGFTTPDHAVTPPSPSPTDSHRLHPTRSFRPRSSRSQPSRARPTWTRPEQQPNPAGGTSASGDSAASRSTVHLLRELLVSTILSEASCVQRGDRASGARRRRGGAAGDARARHPLSTAFASFHTTDLAVLLPELLSSVPPLALLRQLGPPSLRPSRRQTTVVHRPLYVFSPGRGTRWGLGGT